MNVLLPAAIAVALAVVTYLFWRERRLRRRTRLLAEVFDLADALEGELRECRARLREVPALAKPLPGVGSSVSAQATLAAEPQVQDALRDLLAHRLWLREHAEDATLPQLVAARDALAGTRTALVRQLDRLADVRADLEQAREQVSS